MAIFEGKKSSNYILLNDTMSKDEVATSDVPRSTCLTYNTITSRWVYEQGPLTRCLDHSLNEVFQRLLYEAHRMIIFLNYTQQQMFP